MILQLVLRQGLSKRFIKFAAILIAALAELSGSCFAEEKRLIDLDPEVKGMLSSIRTACNSNASRAIKEEYSITNLPILHDGRVGAIGRVGTSHAVGPLRSQDLTVGLLASYYSDDKRCSTFFLLSEPTPRTPTVTSAYRNGAFYSRARPDELDAFSKLLQNCRALGDDAPLEFRDGDYMEVNGKLMKIDGIFDCSVAAERNSSSTRVSLGRADIVISIFGNRIIVRRR